MPVVKLSNRLQTALAARAQDFGRTVRFVFFAAWVVLLWRSDEYLDLSAFDTPFAQLTVNALVRALSNMLVVIALAVIWVKWAFSDGKRDYTAWAGFGAVVLAGIFVYALRSSH